MSDPDYSLDGDPRWQLTQRVASGKAFARSPSLRRFLLFICESALEGREADLKEQRVGHKVLGRPLDYSAAEDNIVRVRARELRRKLEEHFASEGKDEPLVILLPKGGYVPSFQPRAAARATVPASQGWLRLLPWGLAALLAAACGWLLVRDGGRPASALTTARDPAQRIWSQLARPGQETLVVVADSNFVMLQDLTGQNLSLQDYLRQKFLQRPEFQDPSLLAIAARQNTGIGEVNVLMRILRMNPELAGQMRLRFARDLEIRDLKGGNAVLMGARRSNPWVELFEPRCQYVLRYDPKRRRAFIENRAAKDGEPSTFQTEVNGNTMTSYATVSFLPNLAGTGRVLIISGLRTEGTEAAGEFVTVPEACGTLLRKVGFGHSEPVQPFEALLELTSVGGGSSGSEIVAARRLDQ